MVVDDHVHNEHSLYVADVVEDDKHVSRDRGDFRVFDHIRNTGEFFNFSHHVKDRYSVDYTARVI